MNGVFYNIRAGQWPLGNLKFLLLGWVVAEVLAFSFAVKLLGLGGTLLLMFATSVLGLTILRRLGLGAAQHLRRTMGMGGAPSEAFVDGSLTALGAVLLILPGFVSDAVGLSLATPSIRQTLAARFLMRRDGSPTQKPMGRKATPDVIDLSPDDWRVVDKSGRS
ncbi:FxsA family protein [Lichenifustis flavocetrariae]|uniref:FxsA family protein n=1 Tax=Lichenifustis flavocetrariae TaxID=2949735 RepID=A0AA42CK49_9HYPH|nr:FxsA family protein [Lichenifustis flavocetrariae]MCW6510189.1 FxsA family protein [Lichenifustis flavocetrariae]